MSNVSTITTKLNKEHTKLANETNWTSVAKQNWKITKTYPLQKIETEKDSAWQKQRNATLPLFNNKLLTTP